MSSVRCRVLIPLMISIMAPLFVGCVDARPVPDRDGFAMHLLADESISAVDALKQELPELALSEAPLLTVSDFVTYSWKDHSFVLTPQAQRRIPGRVDPFGRPFVAVADGKRLYLGAFWSVLSSVAFPNPVIVIDEPGARRIERAYPTARFGKGEDPRENPLIKEAFRKHGKLVD